MASDVEGRCCLIDAKQIQMALMAILEPGQVTEVRLLDAATLTYRRPRTISGYFEDPRRLIEEMQAFDYTGGTCKGAYFLPNPANPALLARANNRLVDAEKGLTTGDVDVLRRRWLLIDVDPQRPSGISSTEVEHNAALAKANSIVTALIADGWPQPLEADSGNGAHLLYRIHEPADDDGLIEHCLAALADRFDDDQVHVDLKVFNPARIWKLYGTLAAKGDNTPDRPHRMAKILEVPSTTTVVPRALMKTLGDPRADVVSESSRAYLSSSTFDLEQWIVRSGLPVTGPSAYKNNGQLWVLPVCPWNSDHRDNSAFIIRLASGGISAGCHHDGCHGKNWHALRVMVEQDQARQSGPKVGVAVAGPATGRRELLHPDALLRYKPFPLSTIPNPLHDYVIAASEASGSPDVYIVLPLLTAIASLLGNCRRIELKKGWREPPVLWTAMVGDSGTLKTPALKAALSPLWSIQDKARRRYVAAHADYKQAHEQHAKAYAAWKKMTSGPPPIEPQEPAAPRYVCSDVTTEALAVLLEKNPRGILMFRDELAGWFKSYDSYRQGRGGDCEKWLEMFGANPLFIDRKGLDKPTIYVPNAAVCITGGIQPAVLKRVLSGDNFENGLAARFLLVHPPPVKRKWHEAELDPSLAEAIQTLMNELLKLTFDPSADQQHQPVSIGLDDEAKVRWIDFFNENAAEMERATDHRLRAFLSKLEGYTARITLVLHCVESVNPQVFNMGRVQAHTVDAAVALAKWFSYEVRRIYAGLSETELQRGRRELVELIVANGREITCRDLQRATSRFRTAQEATNALDELVQAGYGQWLTPATWGASGRPPAKRFRLLFADDTDRTPAIASQAEVLSVSETAAAESSAPAAATVGGGTAI
jgi:hypothetical protein